MKQLLIGTKNTGKLKEIKSILGKTPFKLISLQSIKNIPKIKETGKTYQANALQKARILVKAIGLPVLAEDSVLEVKALGNKPGIYSARYSGVSQNRRQRDKIRPYERREKNATPERNNQKLLKELAMVPSGKRTARYRCVAVLMVPEDKRQKIKCRMKITEGICKGKIGFAPSGKNGFGYDPLFIPDGYRKTFGELSEGIKNRISHRARAIRKLIPVIKNYLISHTFTR